MSQNIQDKKVITMKKPSSTPFIERLIRLLAALICTTILASICLSCWDSRELDTLMIATGVGIDIVPDEPDKITFSMLIGKPDAAGGGGSSSGGGEEEKEKSFITSIDTKGVMTGIRELRAHNSRTPFLHHTQVLAFGREQAERGIKPHLDVFLREYEMRMEIWVVVADKTAKELLEAPITPDSISAFAITKLMERVKRYSDYMSINMLHLTQNILVPQASTAIPLLRICEKQNPGHKTVVFESLGVFKGDKMISEFPYDNSEGYAWLSGDVKMRHFELFLPEGYANVSLQKSTIKFKPSMDENNNCSMDIELCGDMAISELKGFDNMDLQEILPKLQAKMEEKVNAQINHMLAYAQDLKSDFFGFAGRYHRAFPKKWKMIKDDWDNRFAELKININNRLKVAETGKISNSLQMEKKND